MERTIYETHSSELLKLRQVWQGIDPTATCNRIGGGKHQISRTNQAKFVLRPFDNKRLQQTELQSLL